MKRHLAGVIGASIMLLAPVTHAAVSLSTMGFVEDNRLGIQPGTTSEIAVMLDPALQPVEPGRFIDPWRFHWDVSAKPWDWLRGFIIEIELKVPIPGPDPGPWDVLRITAEFDDPQDDMVMGLEPGSRFVQTLLFPVGTLDPNRIPPADVLRKSAGGFFDIFDPAGAPLLTASVESLIAVDSTVRVHTEGAVGANSLGIAEGSSSESEFMFDMAIAPAQPGFFPDPWDWHWIVGRNPWDWLNGFVIEILREIPIPGPDPGPWDVLRVRAVFDGPEDMVMGLERGSQFIQDLAYPVGTLNEHQLPDAKTLRTNFRTGLLTILNPQGQQLLSASVDSLDAEDDIASLTTRGKVQENQLGIAPGTLSDIDFMLDRALEPVEPGRWIDPWQWHWIVGRNPWDWLFDFIIEIIPEFDPPGPDPVVDLLVTTAVFDDDRDMVMGLERGSRFRQELQFPRGTLSKEHLPDGSALMQFLRGSMVIQDPQGQTLLMATVDELNINDFMDSDTDGLEDRFDNCTLVPNPNQRDADGDGIGSLCDADLSQNCIVNVGDLARMKAVFGTNDPNADMNGSGVVNFQDLGLMKAAFFKKPGPSGVPNLCP